MSRCIAIGSTIAIGTAYETALKNRQGSGFVVAGGLIGSAIRQDYDESTPDTVQQVLESGVTAIRDILMRKNESVVSCAQRNHVISINGFAVLNSPAMADAAIKETHNPLLDVLVTDRILQPVFLDLYDRLRGKLCDSNHEGQLIG